MSAQRYQSMLETVTNTYSHSDKTLRIGMMMREQSAMAMGSEEGLNIQLAQIPTNLQTGTVLALKAVRFGVAVASIAFLLSACGRSAEEKAAQQAAIAEQRHIECLDKICPGDKEPRRDSTKEAIFKRNGRWFVVPKEYGGFNGSLAFFWPSKTPARGVGAEKKAPELKLGDLGTVSNFYDVAIEIFLRSHPEPVRGPSRYEVLKQAEVEGRLVSKDSPRSGLSVWHIKEKNELPPAVWYVATALKGPDGQPPVLACDEQDPKFDRCTTAFMWQPDIAADMRFRAKHGPDWPEIYQETIRILSMLRKE